MVAEIVGVISVSPGFRLGWVIEHDGFAAQPATTTMAPHPDLAKNRRRALVVGRTPCVGERDGVGSLPERHDLAIRLTGRANQPDPRLAAGCARVLLLLVRHRGTSEAKVSSIRSGFAT